MAHVDDRDREHLAKAIRGHVDALCGLGGDRFPGTARNRAATDYVAAALESLGLDVERIPFEAPEWRYGATSLEVEGRTIVAHPGPFSRSAEAGGPLVEASSALQIEALTTRRAVILLHGEIARSQFVPRDYPWYSDDTHATLLAALESLEPIAVIAATGKNPGTTGAQSPFPLIEDPGFRVPSAYVSLEVGEELLAAVGADAHVQIDSTTVSSTGTQLIARLPGSEPGRIVIGAHVDSKPETLGALDNAAGVATLLGAASLLSGTATRRTVEFVPFNGEDHATSPGEVAYLKACGDLSDVHLMINIDDAGFVGAPTACSEYGLDDAARAVVAEALSQAETVLPGPQWPSSDHMIFAMRGIPAIALTTQDVETVTGEITHTPADTPDRVDEALLADAAVFAGRIAPAL
ncbi:MAG: M28 family peptidase [Coriobacteriales bacterium]|nr:M28 family peptidase [Coriobacteriales bacterium]